MEKNIGIWLDNEKAFIITLFDKKESIRKLESPMQTFQQKGEYGTASPYASQDASKERKLNERRKQQLKVYFQKIVSQVTHADNILIFGPAQAKVGLKKVLQTNKLLASKLKDVVTADKMTQNQLVAYVRNYYHQHAT